MTTPAPQSIAKPCPVVRLTDRPLTVPQPIRAFNPPDECPWVADCIESGRCLGECAKEVA